MEFPSSLVEAAWIRQLRYFFDLYNEQYVREQLRPPVFRIGASKTRLGEWDPEPRTITISERHILSHPWERVLDTLRHEMAHQYVHEVLELPWARPHGVAFAKACRLLRCDPAPRATTEALGDVMSCGEATSSSERDRMLRRVRELFALAGSPNEHEAASAMRMANKYLLKYNLKLAEVDVQRHYSSKCIGRCTGRVQEYEYVLSHILQEHFFVLVIWTLSYDPATNKRGRILEVSGAPENVEIAEYVYRYVMNATEALWLAHRKTYPGASGSRLQYLSGLLHGFSEKLDRGKKTLKQEQGLVWLGDRELKEFFRDRHPCTRSAGRSGVSRGERYYAGREDGEQITLRRGVGGHARKRGRLIEE